VPATLFLRRSKITETLKELHGLKIEPMYDKDKNIMYLLTSYKEFSAAPENVSHGSYPLKLLQRICVDVENGKKCSPDLYLLIYKNYYVKYLGNLFLASHLAPLITLITAVNSTILFPGDLFTSLVFLQFVWYFLLIVLQRLFAGNFDVFTEVFYRNWYDKLLNFDTISNDALKNKLFNELHSVSYIEIAKMIEKLNESFSVSTETLSSASSVLASTLKEFTDEKQKGNIMTIETVVASLDANFKRIELLCEKLENIAVLAEESYKETHKFVRANKPSITAINALASEFSNLQKTITDYQNVSESAALERLTETSVSLENNINKTFAAIEETIKANTQYLIETYERFFEISKALNKKQEEVKI
jgi:hypothetical protein